MELDRFTWVEEYPNLDGSPEQLLSHLFFFSNEPHLSTVNDESQTPCNKTYYFRGQEKLVAALIREFRILKLSGI